MIVRISLDKVYWTTRLTELRIDKDLGSMYKYNRDNNISKQGNYITIGLELNHTKNLEILEYFYCLVNYNYFRNSTIN